MKLDPVCNCISTTFLSETKLRWRRVSLKCALKYNCASYLRHADLKKCDKQVRRYAESDTKGQRLTADVTFLFI